MIIETMKQKILAGASIVELWAWIRSIECADQDRVKALQYLANLWGRAQCY